ncbi:MAG: hypothetical protein ACJ8J0_15850 [Longimicrobiaceae bacterium]
MFEILYEVPLDVAVEVVYQAMRRLNVRAPHQDANDGLPPEAPDTPENQALRSVLREIREAEGRRISELSDEAASRYIRGLSELLDSRYPTPSPEMVARADAILAEMRRKYGRAAA